MLSTEQLLENSARDGTVEDWPRVLPDILARLHHVRPPHVSRQAPTPVLILYAERLQRVSPTLSTANSTDTAPDRPSSRSIHPTATTNQRDRDHRARSARRRYRHTCE